MSRIAAVPVVGKIIDKIFPDADQADKARAALTQMAINGELDERAQQAGVIKAEAAWYRAVGLVVTLPAGVWRRLCKQ
ncbi:hypothetical protein [Parendozoicomonas sp. Alg238-R29]|uniref:hypothetical protein n=1 Tax=Parendozoicomonas sp. Alg238-R29 TaxID=2993446 RepID=UPI00248D51E6|nr:hypothetical protein [Parendozoicomonas sp. Alg238-R29]